MESDKQQIQREQQRFCIAARHKGDLSPLALIRHIHETFQHKCLSCVRRIGKEVLEISFATEDLKKAFFKAPRKDIIEGTEVLFEALGQPTTLVTLSDLPFQVADVEIEPILRQYGEVLEINDEVYPGTGGVTTGNRLIRMQITKEVPAVLTICGFRVSIRYPKMKKTCWRCNGENHMAKSCTRMVCHKCGGEGHYARGCPSPSTPMDAETKSSTSEEAARKKASSPTPSDSPSSCSQPPEVRKKEGKKKKQECPSAPPAAKSLTTAHEQGDDDWPPIGSGLLPTPSVVSPAKKYHSINPEPPRSNQGGKHLRPRR